MTVKDRIKAFCKEEKVSVSAFEKSIGVSNGYVNAISRSIGIDYLNTIIEKYSNLNIEWLLTGRGEMLKPSVPSSATSTPDAADERLTSSNKNKKKDSDNQEKSGISSVSLDPSIGSPFYDVDFIGGFDEIFNSQTTVPACNIVVPGFEKASLWCNVTGHSMEPKICHGDIIALHECTVQDIQYGEIYAVVLDSFRTIKILRKGTTSDVMRYVPINPDFDDQEFPVSRILRIFEVLGSIAKFF